MNVPYKVSGQTLTPTSAARIHKGTRGGAIGLSFSFDAEWQDYPKIVCMFSIDGENFDDAARIHDGIAVIPDRYCDRPFWICLIGTKETRKITTEIKRVEVI